MKITKENAAAQEQDVRACIMKLMESTGSMGVIVLNIFENDRTDAGPVTLVSGQMTIGAMFKKGGSDQMLLQCLTQAIEQLKDNSAIPLNDSTERMMRDN